MEIDYEKKYEEALAKARAGKTLEEIFPEMNESEDERIRKLLVWQVHRNIEDETNDLAQSVYDGIKGHDPDLEESIEDWKRCLAYLEKQKELKEIPLMNGDADLYFDNWNQQKQNPTKRQCFEEGIRYDQRLQKEQKLTESISRLTIQGKGVYKICPRCKSRMIRDDSKVYTSMPPQYGYNCPKCGTMEFDTVMYDNPEMEEQKLEEWSEDIIRKAVKEVGLTQHQIDWFKTNVFPPMQEWSEEDREMLNSVLLYFNAPFHDMTDGELKAFNWLKSLPERFILQPKQEWSEKDERKYQCIRSILLTDVDKKVGSWKYSEILEWYEKRGIGRYTNSQPHWKPSEEQMKQLKSAADLP